MLDQNGFEIIQNIYSTDEIDEIVQLVESLDLENRFGVREFLSDHPAITKKVFTARLIEIVKHIAPNCDKSIKSIFFDKPPQANWIVNWHQDLTINLTNQKEVDGFKNWRKTNERIIVQPDTKMLESIFTIRIHLDDCTEENGALRVIEGSHKNGVIEIKDWIKSKNGTERICEVGKGGIVIMKPLTLHSSRRTENNKNRRVIHIEFTDQALPDGLQWKEKVMLPA